MFYKQHIKKLGSRIFLNFDIPLKGKFFLSWYSFKILENYFSFISFYLMGWRFYVHPDERKFFYFEILLFYLEIILFCFYWDFMHSCVILWDLLWKFTRHLFRKFIRTMDSMDSFQVLPTSLQVKRLLGNCFIFDIPLNSNFFFILIFLSILEKINILFYVHPNEKKITRLA